MHRTGGLAAGGEKDRPFLLFSPVKGRGLDGVLGQRWGSGPKGTRNHSNQEDGKQMEPGILQTVEPRRGAVEEAGWGGNGQEASG